MENKVICNKPFTTIYNHLGRNYAPCCWAKDVSNNNPNEVLPIDHFNGEDFRRLRKEMVLGENTEFIHSYCKSCYLQEQELGFSPRTNGFPVTKQLLENFDADGFFIKNKNRFINISINVYGNFCNLECYECNPLLSTSRDSALNKIKKEIKDIEYNENFESNLGIIGNKELLFDLKNADQYNKIVNQIVDYSNNISNLEFVGGEPMLMKSHFILLDKLIETNKSKNINLSYVSNMTLMKLEKMKKYFDNFNRVNIQWSVDALSTRNYWLRYPTNWEETIKNVFEIQSYLKNNKKGKISATITPSILGIVSLRKTYNWLFCRNLMNKENAIFNLLTQPRILRTRHLPDVLKEEILTDVKLISEYHYQELIQSRDEKQFQLAIKYFDLLDKSRGTDWRSTFPEVAKYAN